MDLCVFVCNVLAYFSDISQECTLGCIDFLYKRNVEGGPAASVELVERNNFCYGTLTQPAVPERPGRFEFSTFFQVKLCNLVQNGPISCGAIDTFRPKIEREFSEITYGTLCSVNFTKRSTNTYDFEKKMHNFCRKSLKLDSFFTFEVLNEYKTYGIHKLFLPLTQTYSIFYLISHRNSVLNASILIYEAINYKIACILFISTRCSNYIHAMRSK